jgi:hypothetical protein
MPFAQELPRLWSSMSYPRQATSPGRWQEDWRAVRAFVPALALVLSGCSASELVQNWSGPPAAELSQPDYRRLVTENIKTLLPGQAALEELVISGVRPIDHLKGPAWLTCLRREVEGHLQYFAVFIQGDKIIDFRVAVVIDQCHKETYTPLATTPADKKPGI